jgi:spermidine synthase
MTSMLTTSELALAEEGCARLTETSRPRVLIGGLGLGFTLGAALAALPPRATVVVAELNDKVIEWCRGPVAEANRGAALDRRVEIVLGDVGEEVRRVAEDQRLPRYDAILWDLYVGPTRKGGSRDPLYGDDSVRAAHAALAPGGLFGVWSETPSSAFLERLRKHSFFPEVIETRGAGLRHAVILATARTRRKKSDPSKEGKPRRQGPRKRATGAGRRSR